MLLFFLPVVTACAGIYSTPNGNERAEVLASTAGWKKQWLESKPFPLLSYVPSKVPRSRKELAIYIEGDGLAWLSKDRISPDPTPRNPVALKLALRHPPEWPAVYLARPCQYGNIAHRPPCRPEYWTRKRFSPEVIAATQSAIDHLMGQFGAKKAILIGYSGGGAVAALVAAERRDIAKLITVVSNLDHRAWTSHHRVTPLRGSLNPADNWEALQNIPQYHLVGSDDPIVPPLVVEAYRRRFPPEERPPARIIPGFGHRCCWVEHWPTLLEKDL
uniref:Alpha/beta hydrolase n=1 Tax=Candidatus Kentrum sp. DK TaxID=2126562 RepID=A0A450SRZ7_9GAMM|nr:MAG: hypothetical protein BECKDK2373B_GA0170837_106122 [Candidatus Kentron sp. DK]